jgi:glycosyltransferase involved in cell wall biosynthesis
MSINLLMISIGDDILSNINGEAFKRQSDYAKNLGHIDMIVFSPKSSGLTTVHFDSISIYPTHSLGMLTFIYDVVKIAKGIIKQKKIDVITAQDPFGTALAGFLLKRWYSIPLHVQNHSCFLNNHQWMSEKPLLFNLFNKIAHFTLIRANRLRVVNKMEGLKYINILNINPKMIDIAPVPINVSFWKSKPNEKEVDIFVKKYNINLNRPILSWAGRPVEVKNFPYLFKSVSNIKKLVDINFLIAGNMNNSFYDLSKLEVKNNVTPIYLGLLTHEELRVMYHLTSVYLHTSNYEGFGLVVADAQTCGTVVVTRDTAGARDIVDNNKSGYLVSGNESIFSKKVLEILTNKEKLESMGCYAASMIEAKFNEVEMFNKVILSIKSSIKTSSLP